MEGQNQGEQNAVELFDKARGEDKLLSPKEYETFLKDLTLEDWQAIARSYNNQENLFGVNRRPVIEEKDDLILVHNDEHTIREKDVLTGVGSFLRGIGITGAGLATGWFAGNRFLGGNKYAKWAGMGLGMLTGYVMHRNSMSEIEDIKANANPLSIPKSTLNRSLAYRMSER